MSAFWGVDGALAPPGSPIRCPGLIGPRDGMPLVLSAELAPDWIDGAAVEVERADGSLRPMECATRAPADEENEDRTLLLIGDIGTADNAPVAVRFVRSVLLEDGNDLLGIVTVDITPLEAGPSLIVAERAPLPGPNETQAAGPCPRPATVQIVRTIWQGGVDGDNGQELQPTDLPEWIVEVDAGDGARADVTPIAFSDLDDGDNNVELCLDDPRLALAVRVAAGAVTDPINDPSLAQSVEIVDP